MRSSSDRGFLDPRIFMRPTIYRLWRPGAWPPLIPWRLPGSDLCRILDKYFAEFTSLLKKSLSVQSVVRNTQVPRPKHYKTVDLNP